eukprot:TRINITY_DN65017_c0_g1_i1.p2 TRINITY_DN65017_c0_g1~~TRINITY_DN65017_c0_g1_i1.p2  ORF type:complete len:250 (+),score=91.49 TRINITY_DN65017_c0_g1_i1:100-750(+)
MSGEAFDWSGYACHNIPGLKRPLVVIVGEKGFAACAYVGTAAPDKLEEAAFIVTGVSCPEDFLKVNVLKVSAKGAELGITEGMPGREALKLIGPSCQSAEPTAKQPRTERETIYEVTCQIEAAVHGEFMGWLKPHVQELLALPGPLFTKATIWQLEKPKGEEGTRRGVCVQYTAPSREHLEEYLTVHAPKMRADGVKRFADKLSITRRILNEPAHM